MAKRVNWDFIKPLYRAGKLSNREICRQYADAHANQNEWSQTLSETAIRSKVKKDPKSWEKNLSERIKNQVKENLVRSQVRISEESISDDEIVSQVAEIGSGVIQRHRDEIKALLSREESLLAELDQVSNEQPPLTSLKDKTIILKNIAFVREQRIKLERQAYNLNDDTALGSDELETIKIEFVNASE